MRHGRCFCTGGRHCRIAGFFVALSGLSDAGTKYNNFLLVIAYWIGPWLGAYFADQFLRRGKRVDGLRCSTASTIRG